MKKITIIFLLLFISQTAFGFEDCMVISDTKLTDIRIEDNSITDVFPLVTIMNEKKILIVHPLKEGTTSFSVMKGSKNRVLFNVKVKEHETIIDDVDGFEIQQIDNPPNYYEFKLDTPPKLKQKEL